MLNDIIQTYSDYLSTHPTSLKLHTTQVGIEPIFDNPKIGTLWVPDQAKGRCTQGIVKCIGPEVKDVSVGDYVIFSGYNGDLVAWDNELYIIMIEDMIAGSVTDTPDIMLDGGRYTLTELIKLIASQTGQMTQMHNKLNSRDNPNG